MKKFTLFFISLVSTCILAQEKQISTYRTEDSYTKGKLSKTTTYKKQESKEVVYSITYIKNNYPQKTEYLATDGSVKAELKYKKNSNTPANGTLLTDTTTTVYKNGNIIEYKLLYPTGQLFTHIVLNEGKFYDKKGNLLSTAVYKDNLPFSGKVYTQDALQMSYVHYENGAKEGDEVFFTTNENEFTQKNNFVNGIKTKESFYSNRLLTKQYPIQNNLKEGKALFYSKDQQVCCELLYKQDKPLDGAELITTDAILKKRVYKNGLGNTVVYVADDCITPTVEQTTLTANTILKKLYDDEGQLLYQYHLKNNLLDGEYTFFKNNEPEYTAIFKEGKLIDGTIVLFQTDNITSKNKKNIVYSIFEVTKNTTKIQRYTILNNKLVFEFISDRTKKDANTYFLLESEIDPQIFYPLNDYNSINIL